MDLLHLLNIGFECDVMSEKIDDDKARKSKLKASGAVGSLDILETLRQRKEERERILKEYERLPVKGLILIDNHHLFIELMKKIENFNSDYKNILSRSGFGLENLWDPPNPFHLAELVQKQVIERLSSHLCFETASKYPTEKTYTDADSIVSGRVSGPDAYVALEAEHDVYIFDAPLPERSVLLRELRGLWNSFHCKGQQDEKKQVEEWLNLVHAGIWQFWHDGGNLDLPYEFKNEFIDALSGNWRTDGWESRFGIRKRIVKKKYRNEREKGVDAQLIITACELVYDSSLDWVCLITNDSDYVPLVKHLKKNGKSVYWLSMANDYYVSNDLADAVGKGGRITQLSLFDPSGEIANYRKIMGGKSDTECALFELLFTSCFLHKHAKNKGYIDLQKRHQSSKEMKIS